MAGQFLHGSNVRPSIEQIRNKASAHIVWRERANPGHIAPFLENVKDSLAAHLLAQDYTPAFVNRYEQRPRSLYSIVEFGEKEKGGFPA